MGFLGGVAWALLTARICQLYPRAVPSTLVSRFFRIYTQWPWPAPILLTNIEDGGPLSRKVWNPRINPKDRQHLMPIITPAYPSMNSTYNVSESTKKILLKEFKRGREIAFDIENGKNKSWEVLIDVLPFWEKYKHYLRIDCKAKTEEGHRRWVGFVESRIRFIILKLENTFGVKYVHPHPDTIKFEEENWPFVSAFFLGLRFDVKLTKEHGAKVDLTPAVIDFRKAINEWRDKTEGMEINVNSIIRAQLPDFVFGDKPRPTPQKKRKRVSSQSNNKKSKSSLTPFPPPNPPPIPQSDSPPITPITHTPPTPTVIPSCEKKD